MTKKRRRYTPEQVVGELDERHRQLALGMDPDEVFRHLQIAESAATLDSLRSP